MDNVSLREMRASWRCSAPLTGRRGAGFRNVQPGSVAFFAGQLARWLAGWRSIAGRCLNLKLNCENIHVQYVKIAFYATARMAVLRQLQYYC